MCPEKLHTLYLGIHVISIPLQNLLLCSESQTSLSFNAFNTFVISSRDSAKCMQHKCARLPL